MQSHSFIAEVTGPFGATARAHVPVPIERNLRWLLINDHSRKTDSRVEARVEEILQMHRLGGYVVMRDKDAEITIRKYLPHGPIEGPLPILLQTALDDYELDGILLVIQVEGNGKPHERTRWQRVPFRTSQRAR